MSNFIKSLIWLIVSIIPSILIFFYTFDNRVTEIIAKILAVMVFLLYTFIITLDLHDIVAIKYKLIIIDRTIHVKYLTSLWLFIPYWKPIDTDTDSYETQNIFGATFDNYYETEVTYDTEQDAVHAIEKHKETIAKNKINFFKRPDKEIKQVKYIR